MKARVLQAFMVVLPQGCLIANDVTLRLPDSLFEPDIVIWKPIKERAFIPLNSAIIAVEVADTSLRRDLTKAEDYSAAGLGELWIVDINARETLVYRQGAAPMVAPFEAGLSPLFAPTLTVTIAGLE